MEFLLLLVDDFELQFGLQFALDLGVVPFLRVRAGQYKFGLEF